MFLTAAACVGACSEDTTIAIDWSVVRNGAPIACEQSRVAFMQIDAYKDGTFLDRGELTQSAIAPCASGHQTLEVPAGSYFLTFDALDSSGIAAAYTDDQLVIVGEGEAALVHVEVRAF
ncbi:MAG: hypothetical protein F9K40_01540 [Kofleriaceae bacterium]|nr:MAG: hypothetical protein F9K40_01540 [Kofleriaceae bacterium]